MSIKVFCDAGHNDSGFNTGAVSNGLYEQDITFEVAFQLSQILQKHGIETKLSRPTKQSNLGTDNSSAINVRWKMANAWGADYFISIHANAGGGTGAETLYYKADSLLYATAIQTEYVKHTGLINRGIKYRDNIAVIKHTEMPAALIELAFVDHVGDSLYLKNNYSEMAQAIANGFINYLKLADRGLQNVEGRFNSLNEIPEWGRACITKLINKGYISGTDFGSLNLSTDMLRILVIHDRAGLYGQ